MKINSSLCCKLRWRHGGEPNQFVREGGGIMALADIDDSMALWRGAFFDVGEKNNSLSATK